MYKAFLIGIIIITLSCSKEIDINEPVPLESLLTEKPWVLNSYGLDENRNNQIDPAEESIEDCQKDNTWHYYADGTGLFDDNSLSCANGIEKQPFAWKLNHNKTVIDFFHDSFKVQHIDNSKMILYKELIDVGGNIQRLLFIFRH